MPLLEHHVLLDFIYIINFFLFSFLTTDMLIKSNNMATQ